MVAQKSCDTLLVDLNWLESRITCGLQPAQRERKIPQLLLKNMSLPVDIAMQPQVRTSISLPMRQPGRPCSPNIAQTCALKQSLFQACFKH
eukprot:337762-Pelagomonas_calceolata.AAC.1